METFNAQLENENEREVTTDEWSNDAHAVELKEAEDIINYAIRDGKLEPADVVYW